MMRRGRRLGLVWSTVVAIAAAAGGCQDQNKSSTRPTTMAALGEIPADVVMVKPPKSGDDASSSGGGGAGRSPSDPQPGVAQATSEAKVLSMEAYVISVPAGTVSRSEAFWKRVDEAGVLRPGEYDLMRRNGVRVGLARLEEWGFFKAIIDERPAATQVFSLVSLGGKSVEMEMKKDIAAQNVWYYDGAGSLKGRTYENCQNLWSVGFAPVPRFPDHVRVGVSPLVRSQRKRLEVVERRARPEDPPTREVVYRNPEYLFDLSVEADVPRGRFLVLAPSEEAGPGTLGETFLTGEGIGQRVEKLILMVPRVMAATARPMQANRK